MTRPDLPAGSDRYGDMCCVGALALCRHGGGHPCSGCHVQALAVIHALELRYELTAVRNPHP